MILSTTKVCKTLFLAHYNHDSGDSEEEKILKYLLICFGLNCINSVLHYVHRTLTVTPACHIPRKLGQSDLHNTQSAVIDAGDAKLDWLYTQLM